MGETNSWCFPTVHGLNFNMCTIATEIKTPVLSLFRKYFPTKSYFFNSKTITTILNMLLLHTSVFTHKSFIQYYVQIQARFIWLPKAHAWQSTSIQEPLTTSRWDLQQSIHVCHLSGLPICLFDAKLYANASTKVEVKTGMFTWSMTRWKPVESSLNEAETYLAELYR